MIVKYTKLADLYEADETAWLDAMVELVRRRAHDELDFEHLTEFLSDMARRDRRELVSRLEVLLMHILKWVHQPEKRSPSWAATIDAQRRRLAKLATQSVLRKYAESVMADAYLEAVKRAAFDTDLGAEVFPAECPYSFEEALNFDPSSSDDE